MSTQPSPEVDRILDFWFDPSYPITRWFIKDDALDTQIKTQFGDLIAAARTPVLDAWQSHPRSTLALLILLDQWSRNVYRGTPHAFSGDSKALDVATRAIAKDFEKSSEITLMQQAFFYLPLMHTETLLGQIAGKALYEGYARRCEVDEKARAFAEAGVGMARTHMDVIVRFGRYPGRNEAMGRESTEAEREFLREHPKGM